MAKIPFSIKYRPQIESGEYKVVTSQDYPVQILKWDADNLNTPIFFSYMTKFGEYCTQTSGDDLFIITPEPELSEFEIKMMEIRSLYVTMQEQGVDDRYGDALSANLPGMIKWLTDKIELAKREREFSNAVHIGSKELTPFENRVLKIIDDIVKCITYPNDSCIPNVRTIASELLSIAREQFIKDGYAIVESEHYLEEGRKNYERGKAEALKDLPRWENIKIPATDIPKVWVDALDTFWLQHKNKKIRVQSLEKLPGFEED